MDNDHNGHIVNELEALVLKYNSVAMEYLRQENFKESLMLLKKAEEILNSDENQIIPNRLKLMGITLNNLGCYYKKRKQNKVALTFLEKALEVELQTESDNVNLAGSHLNLCAAFSSLSRHKEGYQHAKQALALLESVYGNESMSFEKTVTLITSLVITYFNAGVELEYMSRFSEALAHYQSGFDIARKELGYKHPMTMNLLETIKKVTKKSKVADRSKSNARESKTPMRKVFTGFGNRLPSVYRNIRPIEKNVLTRNKIETAYEKLRDMTFQAPL